MAIKIHAGDFLLEGQGYVMFDRIHFPIEAGPMGDTNASNLGVKTEAIPLSEIVHVEVASEESVKRVGGTVGWGVAGGLVLGPVGLLAGLLLGGRGKEVVFVAKFKDGRKLLATGSSKEFTKIKVAVMSNDMTDESDFSVESLSDSGEGESHDGDHDDAQNFPEVVRRIRHFRKQESPDSQSGRGFAPSQHENGRMCSAGSSINGISQDYREAYIWYSLAAFNGHPNSARCRDKVSQHLSPGDLPVIKKEVERRIYRQAYVWYFIWALHGYSDAARCRDEVAQHLSPAELSDATQEAQKNHDDNESAAKWGVFIALGVVVFLFYLMVSCSNSS